MNTLEKWIKAREFPETKSLNLLQDAGIISDNCATAAEVADGDCTAAIRFLGEFVPCRLCGEQRRHCHC